jgi:biotin transport system substrate-specific component
MSMNTASSRVLADVVPGGAVRDAALVTAGAGLVGVLAQIAIPLPFTPVPLTMQTFGVLLVCASLGSARGLISMMLYAVMGIAGVPWFAEGGSGFGGASFGYVLGFILAAAVVGRLAERGATQSPVHTAGVMVLGNLAIYAVGVPWLMATAHLGLATALTLGVVPFLVGDLIKVLACSGVFPGSWHLVRRLGAQGMGR